MNFWGLKPRRRKGRNEGWGGHVCGAAEATGVIGRELTGNHFSISSCCHYSCETQRAYGDCTFPLLYAQWLRCCRWNRVVTKSPFSLFLPQATPQKLRYFSIKLFCRQIIMGAQLRLQTFEKALVWSALTLPPFSSLINKPYHTTLIVGMSLFFSPQDWLTFIFSLHPKHPSYTNYCKSIWSNCYLYMQEDRAQRNYRGHLQHRRKLFQREQSHGIFLSSLSFKTINVFYKIFLGD